MYLTRKYLALVSIVIGVLSTIFFPFLKVFLVGNWNLYKVDANLFFVTNGILALLLLFVLFKRDTLYRYVSIVFFVWCLFAIVAVYFKTNNFFGMKLADGLISKSIKMEWGWIVLLLCSIVSVISSQKVKLKLDEK